MKKTAVCFPFRCSGETCTETQWKNVFENQHNIHILYLKVSENDWALCIYFYVT